MKCARCGGLGYREDVQRRNGGEWNVLLQCCDITAYSRAVAERKARVDRETTEQSQAAHVCSVIPIGRKRPITDEGCNR